MALAYEDRKTHAADALALLSSVSASSSPRCDAFRCEYTKPLAAEVDPTPLRIRARTPQEACAIRLLASVCVVCLWGGLLSVAWLSRSYAATAWQAAAVAAGKLRPGALSTYCAVGSTQLQALQCGVVSSLNLLISNALLQASEFMHMIVTTKNIFGAVCTLLSVARIAYGTVWLAVMMPMRQLLLRLQDATIRLHGVVCEQLSILYDMWQLMR